MFVDYTNLNMECLKDFYLLLNIDRLVDNFVVYRLLLFMDAYFGYNQIHMVGPDRIKTAFMTGKVYYQYNVMSFELKKMMV